MDVEVEDVAGGVTCKDVCYKDKCYWTLTNDLRRLPSGPPWNRIKSSYKGGCCFLGRGKCDQCCSKPAAPTHPPSWGRPRVAQAEMNMNDMNDMDVEVEDVAGGVTCKDVCYKDKCYWTLTNDLRRLPSGPPWNRIKSSYKGGCCFLGRGKCDRCCITKNRKSRDRLRGLEA